MAGPADERLKALNASLKEALGKLTGSDELEAEGARERSGDTRPELDARDKGGTRAKGGSKTRAAGRSPRRPRS